MTRSSHLNMNAAPANVNTAGITAARTVALGPTLPANHPTTNPRLARAARKKSFLAIDLTTDHTALVAGHTLIWPKGFSI